MNRTAPQIEVNQRFPVFFPELRPFFLEGQEIYNIPGPVTLVHTRTVVDPRFGAKLSGKIGGTTFSLLVADDAAPGKVDDPADSAFEQSTQSVIARAKFDLYPRSYLGVTFTDREFVDSYSRLAGVDGDFWFGGNYRLRSERSERIGAIWITCARRGHSGTLPSARRGETSDTP